MKSNRRSRPLTIDELVDRLRREFAALPGLKLTESQLCRLWSVDATVSQRVFRSLVEGAYLKKSGADQYERIDVDGSSDHSRRPRNMAAGGRH